MILEVASDPLLTLAQNGILGVVLLLLLGGFLWPKPAVEEMKKQHDLDRKQIDEKVLPAIERLTRNLERNNNLLRQSMASRGVRFTEETSEG
jgi:hypothetical protein